MRFLKSKSEPKPSENVTEFKIGLDENLNLTFEFGWNYDDQTQEVAQQFGQMFKDLCSGKLNLEIIQSLEYAVNQDSNIDINFVKTVLSTWQRGDSKSNANLPIVHPLKTFGESHIQ